MDLDLTFANGTISGDGTDDVGWFVIGGGYDTASLECHWIKTYPGSHDVAYRGFREGKGIWGTWKLRSFSHGGFHIWPKAEGEGQSQAASTEATGTVDAVGEREDVGVPVSIPAKPDSNRSFPG